MHNFFLQNINSIFYSMQEVSKSPLFQNKYKIIKTQLTIILIYNY